MPLPACGRRAEPKTSSLQKRSRWCVLVFFHLHVIISCVSHESMAMCGQPLRADLIPPTTTFFEQIITAHAAFSTLGFNVGVLLLCVGV